MDWQNGPTFTVSLKIEKAASKRDAPAAAPRVGPPPPRVYCSLIQPYPTGTDGLSLHLIYSFISGRTARHRPGVAPSGSHTRGLRLHWHIIGKRQMLQQAWLPPNSVGR